MVTICQGRGIFVTEYSGLRVPPCIECICLTPTDRVLKALQGAARDRNAFQRTIRAKGKRYVRAWEEKKAAELQTEVGLSNLAARGIALVTKSTETASEANRATKTLQRRLQRKRRKARPGTGC